LTAIDYDPEIIGPRQYKLSGMIYYGDPIHSHEGWSTENEIGRLWQRFQTICFENKEIIEQYAVEPMVAYEVHIAPPQSKHKEYHIFVGFETNQPLPEPLELFYKVLPETRYAVFTMKGMEMAQQLEYMYYEWIQKSGYQESHSYMIQRYDLQRYKGLDNQDTEIDFLLPIKEVKNTESQ
jgi:AraC family transcriptional regulator